MHATFGTFMSFAARGKLRERLPLFAGRAQLLLDSVAGSHLHGLSVRRSARHVDFKLHYYPSAGVVDRGRCFCAKTVARLENAALGAPLNGRSRSMAYVVLTIA